MKALFDFAIPIFTVVVGIYISFWSNAIKDISTQNPKPYSFSRTQLMWWTIIILPCFSFYFGYNNKIPDLDAQLLALLGIGTGTATLANLIDRNDVAQNKDRIQDRYPSNGFLYDILDDGSGISVHRFQALIFNLSFGIIFIWGFFNDPSRLPEFNEFELGLLGISSSTYLAIKASENKSTTNSSSDLDKLNNPPGTSQQNTLFNNLSQTSPDISFHDPSRISTTPPTEPPSNILSK